MRMFRRFLAVCLALLIMAPAASAQDHVIGKAALDQAVQQRVSQEQADRDAILTLLQRQEVRDIAAKAGLSIEKAQTAVAMLHGKDLQMAAQQARQAQDSLAGGASTIVISTTTVIIVLLIIILIVVIAN
jgi:membrane protein required for beta-lactamase induction